MEHMQRVRFDPERVIERMGDDNKFKLIYPKEAPGADPDLYNKFQRKAEALWKNSTGTHQNTKARPDL